jgi:hypothetical protein
MTPATRDTSREARLDMAEEIGQSNAGTALDNFGCGDYTNQEDAIAAYLVNAVDTAREYRVSPEHAVWAFMRAVEAAR